MLIMNKIRKVPGIIEAGLIHYNQMFMFIEHTSSKIPGGGGGAGGGG